MQAEGFNLLTAAEMPTYETMLAALQGQPLESGAMLRGIAAADSAAPKVLGSTVSDLVFTPLPAGRCRVADSRVIATPLAPATVRGIDVEDTSSYASEGGNGSTAGDGSTNCGIPSLAAAFLVSVSVLPTGNEGFFKIFENGRPFSEGNTVVFGNTTGASNDVIVRSCTSCALELSVYANNSTHYVVDVIGYFMAPEATALQCINSGVTATPVAAGAQANSEAPACPAGYTQTATNCTSSAWGMPFVFFKDGVCSAQNNGAGAATINSSRTCCRVPGR
jgi:hypothetical protein